MSTKIKFCGFTNPQDVQEALRLPIDYLGFILNVAQSPRSVSLDQGMVLARLVKDCSDKKTVAVVKDLTEEMLEEILSSRVFDVIQLHGGEVPDSSKLSPNPLQATLFAPLKGTRVRESLGSSKEIELWRVVEFQNQGNPNQPASEAGTSPNPLHKQVRGDPGEGNFHIHKLLIDLPKNKTLNLEESEKMRFFQDMKRLNVPLILAGKLTPENVFQKVQTYQPWGVDLASGVELKPGKKDPEKMRKFVQEVFKADSRPEEELWHGVCC